MKIFRISACILCLLSFFVLSASADFIGPYDVSNWTQDLEDDGSINTAPASISMTSSDIGSDLPSNQDFTIAASGDGTVSFDWVYQTLDEFLSAYWDPFGILLNGVFTKLTEDNGPDEDGPIAQSGSVSFSVTTGSVFGFRAHSIDSILGAATTTISNFSFIPVPEPSTILLFGSGFAGVIVWRKMKSG